MSNSLQSHGLYYSPPGSSLHGILQARILEWVANSFSCGSFQPTMLCLLHCRQILYHLNHQGSPSPPGRTYQKTLWNEGERWPLQYCKVISLQLIKINEKKKKKERNFSFKPGAGLFLKKTR